MSAMTTSTNNGVHLPAASRLQVTPSVRRKRAPRRRALRVLAVLFGVVACLGAQSVTAGRASEVIGRIVDESGKPVPYMTASVKGTIKGAFSDSDGVFRVPYEPKSGDSLDVEGIGYAQWSQPLDGYQDGDTVRVTLRSRWDLRGDPAAADSLVRAIHSAVRVEAFRVRGQLRPETTSPTFRHYPVVDTLSQPSRAWRDRLCGVLGDAARDSCGRGPTACIFQPEFAFRFHDQPRPLELLVTRDCTDLAFYRGPAYLSTGSGGGIDCVRRELQELLEHVGQRKE